MAPTPDMTKDIDPQQQQVVQAAMRQLLAMGIEPGDLVEMILEMMGEAGQEVDETKVKQMVKQGV